jgi:hypothetical protein
LTDYFSTAENREHGSLTGKDVDAIARDHILEAGYPPERFAHGLGHGIGVDVREPPMLNNVSQDRIEKGVVNGYNRDLADLFLDDLERLLSRLAKQLSPADDESHTTFHH